MAKKAQRPVVSITTALSDAHWAEINRMFRAFDEGGDDAFWSAMEDLGKKDPREQCLIAASFFPELMRELIKDEFAAAGMSEEDVRELRRRLEQMLADDSGTTH